ncbi:MAG: radical SAM protein [Planctomycetes bacterium]|nr:radical SAM protein [Planctomycetota bacterium]NOG54586.1 radical SAM protein [Planctomycetota bacterium]
MPLPEVSGVDPGWIRAIVSGTERLTREQALDLYHQAPLHALGRWADARCRVLHGDAIRTYVIDRNINYTNVCTAHCTFCAFRRDDSDSDSYTLTYDEIGRKVRELVDAGGTQILMQGGMNAGLPLSWYEDLMRYLKAEFPQVHVHAFSPPEFIEFVRFFDPPGDTLDHKLEWVFCRLIAAGLDSLPGGGGEIFAYPVRRRIGYDKCRAEDWLTVMRVAHKLGLNTSATMMFGHIEGIADRIHHMDLVRDWQDRSIADFAAGGGGRYKAFIAWPFQRENTPLGRVPEWDPDSGEPFPGDEMALGRDHDRFGKQVRMAGATTYLRTQALSRLYLDNIYSIGASWVTMGPHIGQLAMSFGANDMGSVMMEENVVSAAGTTYCLTEPVLCHLIRTAGFIPAQRDNEYNLLRVYPATNERAPDLEIRDWSEQRAERMTLHGVKQDGPAGDVVPITLSQSESN